MSRRSVWSPLILILIGILLAGCGGGSGGDPAANVNLIFVVSPDLAHQGAGDVNSTTANLTNQGLQRSLHLATYLKQQVLRGNNVTAIYALQPMTHLQTANDYPDLASMAYIQQFALLNQISLTGYGGPGTTSYPANSYPLRVSYGASQPLPAGVVTPLVSSADCQGLDFNNANGANNSLAAGIIGANTPGFYVFSAPWETIRSLMADINTAQGYNLTLPAAYEGPDHVYAISITPSTGAASISTYNANLSPPSTFPVLPAALTASTCNMQLQQTNPWTITNVGVGGSSVPANINKNATVYLIRHAEAHPVSGWDDGNYLGSGQWRALYLATALTTALQGKPSPDLVYSIDPAQVYPGAVITAGNFNFSYVRPSLTAEPYAIANNLPYHLVTNIQMFNTNASAIQAMTDYFFTGGTFSNKTILVAWEHGHFQPMITALLQAYNVPTNTVPSWPSNDYDTIWTVHFDSSGNVTVDNSLCEGIDSASLPAEPPQF